MSCTYEEPATNTEDYWIKHPFFVPSNAAQYDYLNIGTLSVHLARQRVTTKSIHNKYIQGMLHYNFDGLLFERL